MGKSGWKGESDHRHFTTWERISRNPRGRAKINDDEFLLSKGHLVLHSTPFYLSIEAEAIFSAIVQTEEDVEKNKEAIKKSEDPLFEFRGYDFSRQFSHLISTYHLGFWFWEENQTTIGEWTLSLTAACLSPNSADSSFCL